MKGTMMTMVIDCKSFDDQLQDCSISRHQSINVGDGNIIPSMLVMELRNFISETHQNCFHQSHLESQSKISFKFITNQTCLTKLQEISSHTRQSCFHQSQSQTSLKFIISQTATTSEMIYSFM